VAERLGRGLQSPVQRFESARRLIFRQTAVICELNRVVLKYKYACEPLPYPPAFISLHINIHQANGAFSNIFPGYVGREDVGLVCDGRQHVVTYPFPSEGGEPWQPGDLNATAQLHAELGSTIVYSETDSEIIRLR
jgi:hypothetical protein